ncbi:MAG: shikimate dehydrogenase [Pseudomonadales bacterium]
MTDVYAVFGNPIAHSKSPLIHAAFARQTDQEIAYERQLVAVGEFASAARAFFEAGGKGLNITQPFKLDAYEYADKLTRGARQAGAVNTLIMGEDGTVLGETTDGVGMVRDIMVNQTWQMADKRILLLGAGGAVRGVLGPILGERPQQLTVANRTPLKAEQLARGFAAEGNIAGCGFDELEGQEFDLVINGTSASLAGEMPPLPDGLLAPAAYCYDMMYGAEPTVFLAWARQQGAAGWVDGLGMLVEQAAESFTLWRAVRPDTATVIADMRAQLMAG